MLEKGRDIESMLEKGRGRKHAREGGKVTANAEGINRYLVK